MELAKIQVDGVSAQTVYHGIIPMGITGATIAVEYVDSMWDGLNKTAVFWGCTVKDVLNAGESVTIPAEVVASSGYRLRVGIYGVDAENNVVIPTVWADIGIISHAADPSGEESVEPDLPVWAQLQSAMGNPGELQTETKQSLVAAVNELLSLIGNTESGKDGKDGATFTPHVSEDGTLSWTNDQGLENPEPVNIMGPEGAGSVCSVNGVFPDSEGNVTLEFASADLADSTYPNCYYRMVDGEKEWINPPMAEGVEYRTTERWLGAPVYMKILNLGAGPDSTEKTVEHGISGKIIDYTGYALNDKGTLVIPYDGYIGLRCTPSAVAILTEANYSGYMIYVRLKYTKN